MGRKGKLFALGMLFWAIAFVQAQPSTQTRPWRIAVIGGQAVGALGGNCPGYLSLLALHGLPRMRLDESTLSDLQRLRAFDIVIACWGHYGSEAAMRVLEQYAYEGGVVLCEGWPLPSSKVIPGKRLGPAPCPNFRFVPTSSPLSQGLPDLGVIRAAAPWRKVGAIIPEPHSPALVLARYTDEEAPAETRGQLRDGAQGAPAVLLTRYGKGWLMYYGPSLSPNVAPPEAAPEHFISRFLKFISGGELAGRLYTGKIDRAAFVTEAPDKENVAEEMPPYSTPAGRAEAPPAGFELLEEPAPLQDFCLTGLVAPNREARVLVGYWSARQPYEEIMAREGQLTIRCLTPPQTRVLATTPLPQAAAKLLIFRRHGLLTVSVDGRLAYHGCPRAPQQGGLAVKGLAEAAYQPLAPAVFRDGFMREEGYAGEWETQSGQWRLVSAGGQAERAVNPFHYEARAEEEAIAVAGYWFWTDLACAVSAHGAAEAFGVIANYRGPEDFVRLQLAGGAAPGAACLQLIERHNGTERLLAEAKVPASPNDWHRLELRCSRGRLQGWLNGRPWLAGVVSPGAYGRIGLYCRRGSAQFDDVDVQPWIACALPSRGGLSEAIAQNGQWASEAGGQALSGQGLAGARLLLPWPPVTDCYADVKIRVGEAEAAGLVLHARDNTATLVLLVRQGSSLRLKAFRQGVSSNILVDAAAPGSPAQWHRLQARYAGPRLEIAVDGRTVGHVLDAAPAAGTVGLYARGKKPAQFQSFAAWSEPADEHLADEPTPEFAGVIDRNSWAGRCGSWTPDPTCLNLLWHAGYFPGPVRLLAGVHPLGGAETTTGLYLAPPGQPEAGYVVRAKRRWAASELQIELAFRGQSVVRGLARVPPQKAYALGLQRCGADVMALVNGQPVLFWRDTQPRPECCALGIDNGGQPLVADDIAVTSPEVRSHTFETAPTDWSIESGSWHVSSRWSCDPGWSWFAGENPEGLALVATREAFVGDVEVVAYMSAKMIRRGGREIERLADVRLGCCVGEPSATSGYQFIVGADDNQYTVLRRNGQEVARCPYRLAQELIHNDWLRLTIRRRGPQLALYVWDSLILQWSDPQPLLGGRIVIGTMRNGLVVPRVTIYGRPAASGLVALSQPPIASPPPRLPIAFFDREGSTVEFGGPWGLWPQKEGCQGVATYVAGEDAEGRPGGAMKVAYEIRAAPRSFSLWMTPGARPVDLTAYNRFVLYARGNVPSLTLVVKDRFSTDPDAPQGIAEFVIRGLTERWQRFEAPFSAFRPRQAGGQIDWSAINHLGCAMIAPQNAEAGTFWIDNIRAEAAP